MAFDVHGMMRRIDRLEARWISDICVRRNETADQGKSPVLWRQLNSKMLVGGSAGSSNGGSFY